MAIIGKTSVVDGTGVGPTVPAALWKGCTP